MNLTLYSSSTTSYNIKLADCGTIDEWASGMGAGFSAVGGTDPVIMKHTTVTYDAAGVVLGDKLNMMQIGTADDPAYMFPDTGINRGAIFSDNTLTGYRNFSFGTSGPAYACTSTVQVPLEWDPDTSNSSIYLAVAYLNGEPKIGYLGVDTRGDTSTKDQCTFWYNETYSSFLLEYADKDPGEKGFKPTGAYTNKNRPGIGGRGSTNKKDPDYAGDGVTQPGAPDESSASAVGCGFINCYQIDTANLQKVGQCLYGSTLLGLLQSISVNPLDFIISLMIFPTNPDVGSAENIKLGGWLAAAAGGAALGFDATGNRLASEFKVVDFGTVQIPENWGSFLDYQTQIELYLPFVGTVSIDVSECMGGSINVQYTIDFFTGMCVANVLCSKPSFVLPSGKVIQNVEAQHAYQGNCAIQIPLSAINYGNMVGSLINACTQGITNPVMGLAHGIDTGISGGFRPTVSSKGNIVANSGFCSVLYPYVRITRPITAEPESYQEVMGYPSYINTTLGECEDLCVCDDIDLKGIIGATDNEINRIRQMCKEGVYV